MIHSALRANVEMPFFRHIWDRHSRRLCCFGLVGISGVTVNMVILFFLVRFAGCNHVLAAAIGSEVSILSNFALNDRWTFRDAQSSAPWMSRAMQYNAVTLGGMGISLGVLAALTGLAGMNYLIANLIAIAFATISNYVLNSRFTWGTSASSELIAVPAGVYAE